MPGSQSLHLKTILEPFTSKENSPSLTENLFFLTLNMYILIHSETLRQLALQGEAFS